MGIQQSVNAISAGVLGAVVAGKHLKQQETAVKGAEIRELAGLDREIADKTDEVNKLADEHENKVNEYFKAEKDKADIEKKLKDKRLNPAGKKYGSYLSALDKIEVNESELNIAIEAAFRRSQSAEHELSIYKNRKEELEKKYGKYKW